MKEEEVLVAYDDDASPVSQQGRSVILIRNMKLKDVSNCYTLGQKLFAFSSSLSRTFDRFVVIGGYSNNPEYSLVAELGGQIIGFCLGNTVRKEKLIGYLSWIAVDPAYQVMIIDFY